DDDKRIYDPIFQIIDAFLPYMRLDEFRTSRRIEFCAAPLDDVTDIRKFKLFNIIIYKALIALVNNVYFYSLIDGLTYYSPKSCNHTRRISTAGQYCNFFHEVTSVE